MKKINKLTEKKVNRLLNNIWKEGSINTYPSGFYIKKPFYKALALLDKYEKYKYKKSKNKFMKKNFGLCNEEILTISSLIKLIIKVSEMK